MSVSETGVGRSLSTSYEAPSKLVTSVEFRARRLIGVLDIQKKHGKHRVLPQKHADAAILIPALFVLGIWGWTCSIEKAQACLLQQDKGIQYFIFNKALGLDWFTCGSFGLSRAHHPTRGVEVCSKEPNDTHRVVRLGSS